MKILNEIKLEYKYKKENENKEIDKCFIFEHYKIVVAILLILISFIFYYSLIEVGIPIQAQKSNIENLIPFIAYGTVLLIIVYTLSTSIGFVIGTLYGFYKYKGKFSEVVVSSWFLMKNKMFRIVIIATTAVIILNILVRPMLYIYDKSINKNTNIFNDYILLSIYYNYHSMTGFPKIVKIDEKKYLLNGYDGNTLYVQDLNKTVDYMKNYDDIKYRTALCGTHTKKPKDRTIIEKVESLSKIEYELDTVIAYDVIRLSPYTSVSNNEIIFRKLKDSLNTYKLNLENLDINKTKFIDTCRKIHNKNG